ncbi:MAG: ANTAR domain-containing protein [Acidimicrobiales bacterium]
MVTQAALAAQAGALLGEMAVELADTGSHQTQVNQAAGMVAVQLGVGVAEALVRLRAHAFVTSCPLSAVATDVIARRLRLES